MDLENIITRTKLSNSSRAMLRGSAATMLIKIIGLSAGFFLHFLLAKYLSVSEYGTFSFVTSFAVIVSVVVRLGFDTWIVKFLSRSQSDSNYGHMHGAIVWSICVTLGITLLITSLLLMFDASFSHYAEKYYFAYSIPLAFILAMLFLARGVLRSFGLNVLAFAPEAIGRNLFAGSAVIVVLLASGGVSLGMTFQIYLFSVAAFTVFSWLCVIKYTPVIVKNTKPIFKMKDWSIDIFPIFIANFIFTTEIHIVILLSGILLSSEETAAVSLCLRLAALVTVTMVAINMYIAPRLAYLIANNQNTKIQSFVTKSSLLICATSLPVIILVTIFGYEILTLFGNEYVQYAQILYVLMCGRLLMVLLGPVNLIMQMGDLQKSNAIVSFIFLFCFIALCFGLLSVFRVTGLAILFCLLIVGRQLVNWLIVNKCMGVYSGVVSLKTLL